MTEVNLMLILNKYDVISFEHGFWSQGSVHKKVEKREKFLFLTTTIVVMINGTFQFGKNIGNWKSYGRCYKQRGNPRNLLPKAIQTKPTYVDF
jgi:hypothetical protein